MLVLVLAGEMIFGLPFHTARFFRPTLLDAFGFSNTQLGDVFAVYGVTAMLAYFPGGALADRFPARKLMGLSLLATAAGGLYMATFPGFPQMAVLYGYWGVTTIFLFWAAMIRMARDWGGSTSQGLAFGVLDGGRGLAAAGFALLAVSALAMYLPLDSLGSHLRRGRHPILRRGRHVRLFQCEQPDATNAVIMTVQGIWLHVRTVARVKVRLFGEYVIRSECGPYDMVLIPAHASDQR